MKVEEIEKLVGIATILLPEFFMLVGMVKDLILDSDLPEQTKEELINRIRQAQASVPEWI